MLRVAVHLHFNNYRLTFSGVIQVFKYTYLLKMKGSSCGYFSHQCVNRNIFPSVLLLILIHYGVSQKSLQSQPKVPKTSYTSPYSPPLCESMRNNTCPKWVDAAMSEIETAMRCYFQPPQGLVIAIVHNQSDSIVKNFGYAAIEQTKKPMTVDTKFVIGSLSKAFTATLLGILLSEQKEKYPKSWDTKIIDIMGKNYSLIDELRTKQCTILDILAHRVGLQTYNMILQTALDPKIPIQEYCKRLHHVEKSGLFRSKYEYNNILFILASCVAEKLGNHSFPQLMKEKIFLPLGMNDTELITDSRKNNYKNLAQMYYRNQLKEIKPLNMEILRSAETLLGAGGIVSTSRDICKWMKFHLNEGRNDQGEQLIPANYWAEMHSRYMINRKPGLNVERPLFPVTNTLRVFGLGWKVGHYRGFRQSEHTGDIGGFISKITLLPKIGIGVFTITNGPAYFTGDLQMATHFYLLDNLLKVKTWLNSSTICSFPKPWLSMMSPKTTQPSAPRPSSTISMRVNVSFVVSCFENYTGHYGHPIFGNLTIFRNLSHYDTNSKRHVFEFRLGLLGSGRLNFFNATMAIVELTGAMRYILTRNSIYFVFRHQDLNTKQFKIISAFGFEPNAPVIFKRNLLWDYVNTSAKESSGSHISFVFFPINFLSLTFLLS